MIVFCTWSWNVLPTLDFWKVEPEQRSASQGRFTSGLATIKMCEHSTNIGYFIEY